MKLISFSRKYILRAIRAAAIALYFASISAHAQTATVDGQGNVTISGTGSNFIMMA